ncbi:MAG: hypothetical protein ACI9TH_000858 [Kiritimatiellia bacterium]|jgi:hypothetical protein
MKTRKAELSGMAVLGLALFAFSLSAARADLITISATAPVPDADDISMLNATGQYDIGGDQGHIWFNRPVQGQTFTTGSNAGGYLLNAVTLQNRSNNVATSPTFTLRVGTVSGTSFAGLASATGVAPAYVGLDYITFNLDAAIPLLANTQYGFDWGSNGSGFVTANNDDSNYLGGSAYSSGAAGVGDATIIPRSGTGAGTGDRIFHLDIVAIPEPSSAALCLLGLALLVRRRR